MNLWHKWPFSLEYSQTAPINLDWLSKTKPHPKTGLNQHMSNGNGSFKIKPSQDHRLHKQMAGWPEGPSNTGNALAPPVVQGPKTQRCVYWWHGTILGGSAKEADNMHRVADTIYPVMTIFWWRPSVDFPLSGSDNLLAVMAGLPYGRTLLHSHRFLSHCQQLSQPVRRMRTEWLENALDSLLSYGGLCCPLLPIYNHSFL